MTKAEKLEVPDKLLYDPTLKNRCPPIVGNLTFFPPLCNSTSSYFGIMNSFELTWDRRTNTSNIIPKTEKIEVPDKLLYDPTLENGCRPIVGNLTFFHPCVTVTKLILELCIVLSSHGIREQVLV